MGDDVVWSDAETEYIREHIGRYSFSEMAAELSKMRGSLVSRNAVIGKASRLGLSRGRRFKVKQVKPKAQRPIRTTPFKAKPVKTFSGDLAKESALVAEPSPENVPLMKTKKVNCRWPVRRDDATQDMICCGRPIHHGSYCEFHHHVSKRSSEPEHQPKRAPFPFRHYGSSRR